MNVNSQQYQYFSGRIQGGVPEHHQVQSNERFPLHSHQSHLTSMNETSQNRLKQKVHAMNHFQSEAIFDINQQHSHRRHQTNMENIITNEKFVEFLNATLQNSRTKLQQQQFCSQTDRVAIHPTSSDLTSGYSLFGLTKPAAPSMITKTLSQSPTSPSLSILASTQSRTNKCSITQSKRNTTGAQSHLKYQKVGLETSHSNTRQTSTPNNNNTSHMVSTKIPQSSNGIISNWMLKNGINEQCLNGIPHASNIIVESKLKKQKQRNHSDQDRNMPENPKLIQKLSGPAALSPPPSQAINQVAEKLTQSTRQNKMLMQTPSQQMLLNNNELGILLLSKHPSTENSSDKRARTTAITSKAFLNSRKSEQLNSNPIVHPAKDIISGVSGFIEQQQQGLLLGLSKEVSATSGTGYLLRSQASSQQNLLQLANQKKSVQKRELSLGNLESKRLYSQTSKDNNYTSLSQFDTLPSDVPSFTDAFTCGIQKSQQQQNRPVLQLQELVKQCDEERSIFQNSDLQLDLCRSSSRSKEPNLRYEKQLVDSGKQININLKIKGLLDSRQQTISQESKSHFLSLDSPPSIMNTNHGNFPPLVDRYDNELDSNLSLNRLRTQDTYQEGQNNTETDQNSSIKNIAKNFIENSLSPQSNHQLQTHYQQTSTDNQSNIQISSFRVNSEEQSDGISPFNLFETNSLKREDEIITQQLRGKITNSKSSFNLNHHHQQHQQIKVSGFDEIREQINEQVQSRITVLEQEMLSVKQRCAILEQTNYSLVNQVSTITKERDSILKENQGFKRKIEELQSFNKQQDQNLKVLFKKLRTNRSELFMPKRAPSSSSISEFINLRNQNSNLQYSEDMSTIGDSVQQDSRGQQFIRQGQCVSSSSLIGQNTVSYGKLKQSNILNTISSQSNLFPSTFQGYLTSKQSIDRQGRSSQSYLQE